MKYVLDTNTCIYIIKNKPAKVVARLEKHALSDIALSAITTAELWYGVEKSQHKEKNERALWQFLSPFEVLSLDTTIAHISGIIRAKLEKQGKPIGAYDLLIAATAIKHNLTLVTNNEKEFSRISGITLENWTK